MGITHHAIEQYRARFGGDEDALRELVGTASPTRERGAYLRGANLSGADLRGAYLRGANLGSAYRGSNQPPIPGWRANATGYLEREP